MGLKHAEQRAKRGLWAHLLKLIGCRISAVIWSQANPATLSHFIWNTPQTWHCANQVLWLCSTEELRKMLWPSSSSLPYALASGLGEKRRGTQLCLLIGWLLSTYSMYMYFVGTEPASAKRQCVLIGGWGEHHLPCILGGSEKDLSLLLHHAMRHKVLCQRFCCPGSDFFLDKLLSFPFLPVWTGLTWLGQTKKCHCSCQGHCNNKMSFSRVTRSKRGQSGSVPLTVYGNGNSSKCTSLQPDNEKQLLKSLLLLHLRHKSSALHTA